MVNKKLICHTFLTSSLFIAGCSGLTLNSQLVKAIANTAIDFSYKHLTMQQNAIELNVLTNKIILGAISAINTVSSNN